PEKVVAFLKTKTDDELDRFWVALPLPELPPYYTEKMELHAVIDRGDVWYDYPFTKDGKRVGGFRKRMPRTTLFVKWNEQEIPLVTMNTTIGSWRTELAPDGYEYFKYKNSDVGPRVWKEIFAGPVWLPPDTTPPADLFKTVRHRGRLVKVPNYDEFGPWYASAYGLVAGFHVREVERPSGKIVYIDNGIRSHGSVDYNSILRRYSHGCHRLYNHLAIRLFDFILRHREFNRLGKLSAGYSRKVEIDDEVFFINIGSRGYRYELVDAVPIEVLRGRVRGKQRSPIEIYMPKPDEEYGPDAQFLPADWDPRTEADAGVPAEPSASPPSDEPAKSPDASVEPDPVG
ncbi:MAG: L,D-transpeptidase, partial [Deltaproteobacteria bacterium]|nr:L,D-transpeptidase [Deltaproteobacteria bacterium]